MLRSQPPKPRTVLALALFGGIYLGPGSAFAFAGSIQPATATPASAPAIPAVEQSPLRAVVSIPPLAGLIAPLIDAANADLPRGTARPNPGTLTLIPPGESEHGFEIPPSRLNALRQADLVVLVGLGLEPQVEKFLADNPPAEGRTRTLLRLSDIAGIKPGEHVHDHEHEDEHGHNHDHDHAACEHDHSAGDPHLWLDPVEVEKLVVAATRSVADRVRHDPARKTRVEAAGTELRTRVLAIHESYAMACGGFSNKTIVVGHDAWGRLAARYGLETVAIAGLNAGEPTPKALQAAADTVRAKNLKVIFVEPQLGERAGRRVAEATGAEVRRLDPLGRGDWFAMMNDNLEQIKGALAPTPKPDDRTRK